MACIGGPSIRQAARSLLALSAVLTPAAASCSASSPKRVLARGVHPESDGTAPSGGASRAAPTWGKPPAAIAPLDHSTARRKATGIRRSGEKSVFHMSSSMGTPFSSAFSVAMTSTLSSSANCTLALAMTTQPLVTPLRVALTPLQTVATQLQAALTHDERRLTQRARPRSLSSPGWAA